MSCLCPGQELEWHWDLLSMVGVSCENPQNPPAKAAQGFLPVQFNSSVGCSLQFLSQGCFPLGFKSVVSLQGASGSHCWIWLCWCSSVHPHFGKLLFPRPLTALSCCGQLPQAPRATQGGWGCRLIFINRAANYAWQSLGRVAGEHQQLCQDLPGAFSLSLQVSSRSQRGNTALSVPRRSSARSGSRPSGEPGGLSPQNRAVLGALGSGTGNAVLVSSQTSFPAALNSI